MERTGHERDTRMQNSYNPPQIIQESPVKLPLAPIISTPPDRRGNAMVSARRGSSIFSPNQTLDQPYNFPPPLSQPLVQKDPSPDPDPPSSQPHEPPPQAAGATTSSNDNTTSVKYRECLKNHAASMGGHVVDGCGEFMPSGEEGTAEALKCAACDCHRNFHRKEVDGEAQPLQPPLYHRNPSLHGQTPASHLLKHSHPNSKGGVAPPTIMNFGGGGAAAESSSEDLDLFQASGGGHTDAQPSKKRFRTKFSQEQKDRMQEFAVRLGWRIQKQDAQEVQQFCDEVGVKRQVFKVWMHNNKQAMKKRQI